MDAGQPGGQSDEGGAEQPAGVEAGIAGHPFRLPAASRLTAKATMSVARPTTMLFTVSAHGPTTRAMRPLSAAAPTGRPRGQRDGGGQHGCPANACCELLARAEAHGRDGQGGCDDARAADGLSSCGAEADVVDEQRTA